MSSILLMLGCFVAYLIAYYTYGRYLSRKIFQLNPNHITPSNELNDGIDYLPTHKEILFGHHYTSIAGTGPIVGPAIAIIWGWLPAILWVLFGAIFMGAVHDFGALVLSTRHQGKSISEITKTLINPRVRILFFLITLFALLIVIAIFGWIIAFLFARFPVAVFPIWAQIPIALVLGWLVYRKGYNHTYLALGALVALYVTVVIGAYIPLEMPALFGIDPFLIWIFILMAYAFVASILPVNVLLQPRDYINGHQLFVALGLLVLGTIVARPEIVAPVANFAPDGAPAIIPFLFITIACGAVSGFHSLVASGTSSKQLNREDEAQFIGYGAMLLEGVLAVLVIIAVAAGIGMHLEVDGATLTGATAWNHHYASWAAAQGLGAKVSAFIIGSANMIEAVGIPRTIALVIMGVFVASFAGTTLDTATRIQRYVITELASDLKIKPLMNRYVATSVAVISALVLALSQQGGKGALMLWPLFGTVNQLLAGLTLLTVTVYLFKLRRSVKSTLIPMVIIFILTSWAMLINLGSFINKGAWHLLFIGGLILAFAIWMVVEAVFLLVRPESNIEKGKRTSNATQD